jgi:3-demethoxyubiquinol 3-hydroxylase
MQIENYSLPKPVFSVMYDGSCPLCLREISIYRSAKSFEPIQWVDVSVQNDHLAAAQCDFMARFHVQQRDGQLLSGAAALVALWERIPGWRLLAAFVKIFHLTRALEFAYVRFLVIRPQLQKIAKAADTSHLPQDLVADIRSDHAGETGAVYIYKGILAVSKDTDVRNFATEHLHTEQEHLRQLNVLFPILKRSLLLPGWRIAGFVTGAVPALFGAKAVFATIQAVETFVNEHYEYQIHALAGREDYAHLKNQLITFQADEVAHRDEAQARQTESVGILLSAWCALVGWGSSVAVKFAKLI